jgi:hypothetical protein
LRGVESAGLRPIDHQLAFAEVPRAVVFNERIQIADRGGHEAALRTVDLDVVGHAVGHSGGAFAVESRGALAIEVHRRHVRVELVEYRSKRGTSVKVLRRRRIAAVHVHQKLCGLSEQRHLTGSIAPIRTVCVSVDQFSNRQPVRHLLQ